MSEFLSSPYALLTIALVVLAIAVLMLMVWLLSIDRRMRGVADGLEIERRKVAEMQMVIGRRNAARNYGKPQTAPAQGVPRERAARPEARPDARGQRPAQGRPAPTQSPQASPEAARPRRERPAGPSDVQQPGSYQARPVERSTRSQQEGVARASRAPLDVDSASAVSGQRVTAARDARSVSRERPSSTTRSQTRAAAQPQSAVSNQPMRTSSSQPYGRTSAASTSSETVRSQGPGVSRGRHARP